MTFQQPNRITPNLPVEAYKTYRVTSPLATHWRAATCAEVDCPAHVNGWQSTIDETTILGQQQAFYIRKQSGRRFTEERPEAGLTRFRFEAGQRCFGQHQVPLGRPELYLVRGGDWRGNPTGELRQHTNAQDWIDDFGEHQDNLADQIRKG
ncbi:MAG: hypothetical protein HOZ81_20585 [Streptomyces sp.]|nr:hypothetical protein [Streptomyces sp.]NUS24422.1 hypothetical protein [Streptomyces sp.]